MKKIFKWAVRILGAIVALIVLAVISMYAISQVRLNKTYDIQPEAVTVPTGEAAIAEGKRQFYTHACVDCHNVDGGGKLFLEDPLIGTISGANLTPGEGGAGQTFTDIDWVRAIRHGVHNDGSPLVIMPSYEYNLMNNEDLGHLIAYLKSLSAVDHVVSKPVVGPVGRMLIVTGMYPLLSAEVIDHLAPRPEDIARAPTAEYGHYLVSQSCMGCHGQELSGGPIPGVPSEPPYPQNLTPDVETGLGTWTQEDFARVIRQGQRPDGTVIDPANMPWSAFLYMTDDEITAIWLYLQSVPAKPYGNR